MILTDQAKSNGPAIPKRMKNQSCLGAVYSPEQTLFTLWAPSCSSVQLRLYKAGSEAESALHYTELEMEEEDNGLFSKTVKGDLHGIYYNYILNYRDGTNTVSADPWANACGVNGKRSMVVDLSRTNPEGWEKDERPQTVSPMIWEAHVRDFSSDPACGVREVWRGKYLAFTEENTHLVGTDDAPTCVAYLKKLGVTHVQLQPIADYCTVDERNCSNYNWGYDIENYNVPEGSYSADPYHGEVRIRECKQMIQALHKAGIGVVLDVVYNHTYYSKWSWLARTAPGEYYRHRADGHFYNASGCGCETKSERWPFQNYMLQSVLYWAKEYHVDGFRFDLMAVHDTDTMNLIRHELDKLPGGKKILMYGEPWTALPPTIEPPAEPADKSHVKQLSDRIGVFCDATRDTIAGPAFDPWTANYSSGEMQPWMVRSVQSAVRGWSCEELDHYMGTPMQCVHYASAHDNYTLWDRLILQRDSRDFDGRHPHAEARQRIIAGIVLTCSGLAFMQSGEEFLRTKHGNDNTYNGPAEINRLNWSLTVRNSGMLNWYRGLIQLRQAMAHIANLSNEAANKVNFIPMDDGAIAFSVPAKRSSGWNEFVVCYNPLKKDVMLPLPAGKWQQVCDGMRSDLRGVACRVVFGSVVIPQVNVLIFAR